MEHPFVTYVRTKLVYQHRLKDLQTYSVVRLFRYELKKFGVDYGPSLHRFKETGQLSFDDDGNFSVLTEGPLDFSLLKLTEKRDKPVVKLSAMHRYMRSQLSLVSLDKKCVDPPVYFQAFLDHRNGDLSTFFTVDAFSGRVHTPICSLKQVYRPFLRLAGSTVCSVDVKQMQPTILAKILVDVVGNNPFSDIVFSGKDVYLFLMKEAGLPSRSDAKKFLYQLIFGFPRSDLAATFKGNPKWMDWINSYKSTTEKRNPHSDTPHTNLAWLLQFSEVSVMSSVWKQLVEAGIPFLTIHDDVVCRKRDLSVVKRTMNKVLEKYFKFFELTITCY